MSQTQKNKPGEATHRIAPRLDDFLTVFADTNPFIANRITEPSPYDVDVPAIHSAEFERLVSLAGQAMRQKAAIGVALLGAAGVGKSHLLSRLYRWANSSDGSGGARACYVYLHNILADPDRLPRYMLKYVVSRLSEGGCGPLHQTPLYRFVDRGIRHALESAGVRSDRVEDKLKDAVAAYRSYFGKAAEYLAAYVILFQFWRFSRPEKANEPGRRNLALSALAWLSGDEVDPAFAAKLELKTDGQQPVMLHDDQEVEQVLTALSRLALVSGQPFVLCIDQVENLDPDKLKPLTRFLHALLDHAANLLLITSGVKKTLLAYREEEELISEAAWDRIAQYKIDLSRVLKPDARKILEARLERFLEPFVEVNEVRTRLQEDSLFPLGLAWFEERLGDGIEFRPRDVLTWARDAWDQRQAEAARMGGAEWFRGWPLTAGKGGAEIASTPLTPAEIESSIDITVERKMAEQIAQHRLQPGSLPPDAGNLAGLVESLLGQCRSDGLPYTFRGVERAKKKGGKLPPYDLLVRERRERDGREVTTGVVFVTNIGLSASAALRRLLQAEHAPDHRLLVTDERRPLKVGAQGVAYYEDLKKLGKARFEHLKITFEQYAALDGLRDVVGMARSGDLEIESPPGTPCPVTEVEVIASHHRKDRYRLHPLLRPLLTEEPLDVKDTTQKTAALNEGDVRQYIMARLAWMMGSPGKAITENYLAVIKNPKLKFEDAWPQVKAIAGQMHAEGLLHASPQDDDLFLLLRK